MIQSIIKKINQNPDYKQLIKNFYSLSVLKFVIYLLPLISLPYLVRVLGAEKYGLIAFSQAVTSFIMIITDYGFNYTATKEISIHRDDKKRVEEIFSSAFIIKGIITILCFIIFMGLIFSVDKFSTEKMFYFLSYGLVIGNVLFPIWFFQGIEQMQYITFVNLVSRGIFTVLTFILIKSDSDYLLVPVLNAIGSIAAGLISLKIIRSKFKIRFTYVSHQQLIKDFKEGFSLFLSTMGLSLYRYTNTIILGFLCSGTVVGYYAIAEKLTYLTQEILSPITGALYPYLSRKYSMNSVDKSIKGLLNLSKYYVCLLIILSMIIILFSNNIINIAFGDSYINSVNIFRLMMLVVILGGLNYWFGILGLVNLNFDKDFSKFVLICGFLNILQCFILGYYFQGIGAAVSLIVTEGILLLLIALKLLNINRNISKQMSS